MRSVYCKREHRVQGFKLNDKLTRRVHGGGGFGVCVSCFFRVDRKGSKRYGLPPLRWCRHKTLFLQARKKFKSFRVNARGV